MTQPVHADGAAGRRAIVSPACRPSTTGRCSTSSRAPPPSSLRTPQRQQWQQQHSVVCRSADIDAPAYMTAVEAKEALSPDACESWDACAAMLGDIGLESDADRLLAKGFGWTSRGYFGAGKANVVPDPEGVIDVLSYLQGDLNIQGADLTKVIKAFPEVMACSINELLRPNVKRFEAEWFMKGDVLSKAIVRKPTLLGLTVDCSTVGSGACMGQCSKCCTTHTVVHPPCAAMAASSSGRTLSILILLLAVGCARGQDEAAVTVTDALALPSVCITAGDGPGSTSTCLVSLLEGGIPLVLEGTPLVLGTLVLQGRGSTTTTMADDVVLNPAVPLVVYSGASLELNQVILGNATWVGGDESEQAPWMPTLGGVDVRPGGRLTIKDASVHLDCASWTHLYIVTIHQGPMACTGTAYGSNKAALSARIKFYLCEHANVTWSLITLPIPADCPLPWATRPELLGTHAFAALDGMTFEQVVPGTRDGTTTARGRYDIMLLMQFGIMNVYAWELPNEPISLQTNRVSLMLSDAFYPTPPKTPLPPLLSNATLEGAASAGAQQCDAGRVEALEAGEEVGVYASTEEGVPEGGVVDSVKSLEEVDATNTTFTSVSATPPSGFLLPVAARLDFLSWIDLNVDTALVSDPPPPTLPPPSKPPSSPPLAGDTPQGSDPSEDQRAPGAAPADNGNEAGKEGGAAAWVIGVAVGVSAAGVTIIALAAWLVVRSRRGKAAEETGKGGVEDGSGGGEAALAEAVDFAGGKAAPAGGTDEEGGGGKLRPPPTLLLGSAPIIESGGGGDGDEGGDRDGDKGRGEDGDGGGDDFVPRQISAPSAPPTPGRGSPSAGSGGVAAAAYANPMYAARRASHEGPELVDASHASSGTRHSSSKSTLTHVDSVQLHLQEEFMVMYRGLGADAGREESPSRVLGDEDRAATTASPKLAPPPRPMSPLGNAQRPARAVAALEGGVDGGSSGDAAAAASAVAAAARAHGHESTSASASGSAAASPTAGAGAVEKGAFSLSDSGAATAAVVAGPGSGAGGSGAATGGSRLRSTTRARELGARLASGAGGSGAGFRGPGTASGGAGGDGWDPMKEVQALMRTVTRDEGDDEPMVFTSFIGRGGFGAVYAGRWRNLDVAIKVAIIQQTPTSPDLGNPKQQAILEAAVSASAVHPNVVTTYYHNISEVPSAAPGHPPDWRLCLVQELCQASLTEALLGNLLHNPVTQAPDHALVLSTLLDVARGMAYLNEHHIIHGDLKPDNVMLVCSSATSVGMTAKIIDFGLSRAMDPGRSHVSGSKVGTQFYIAPETAATGLTKPAADVYSFGMLAAETYTSVSPWVPTDTGFGPNLDFFKFRPGTPGEFIELTTCCVSHDPERRPTFKHLVERLGAMHADAVLASTAAAALKRTSP
ncbi:hypothetical protein FOA52_007430 [Chlamydomonas sp. UWO 241]|nr:hypothetical protein FOA52_007430 [Chlamydomonas sp. UWO 241]